MFHTKTQRLIVKGTISVLALSSLMFASTLADDYLYVNATHLNVRAANTFRSAIVATVGNGYKVTVLESQNNGWKKVLLENGQEGYVNGRYLTEQAPYFEKAQGSMYTVHVYSAYLRGEGLVKKVAVLHKGDRLEILDEKVFLGKWLRVRVITSIHGRYNERVGYVAKNLVRVDENSTYTNVVSEEAKQTMDTVQMVETPATQVEDAQTTEDDASILEDLGLNSAPAEEPTVTESTTESTDESSDESMDLLGDLLK